MASQPARPGAAAYSSIPSHRARLVSLPALVQRATGLYLACTAQYEYAAHRVYHCIVFL